MRNIKAGELEISVGDPYPVWIKLYKGEEKILTISHNELSDLKYIVDKAIKEARLLLPRKDRDEV